jgi:hypothetical protein
MNTLIYNLQDFTNITFDGFNLTLPEETIQIISNLSLEVGSPTYVKTPIFRKRENPLKSVGSVSLPPHMMASGNSSHFTTPYKKKRGNRSQEIVNDEDWEALRNFHTTKIEQKIGVEAHVDIIRSNLNKITDKNYSETKSKIFELLNQVIGENENKEDIMRISSAIFEIASTNRFYSKIYADLYTELILQYEPMRLVFQESFDSFMDLFHHIEYVDSSLDYDKFCKINKDNEKRKALSAFFINLMNNQVISKEKIIQIIQQLLVQVSEFIQIDDKKNEVDELSENIVLLFQREFFVIEDYQHIKIGDLHILEYIEFLAKSKNKDFKSLTNKTIFKFMDMVDM